jgi:hypothetical protein
MTRKDETETSSSSAPYTDRDRSVADAYAWADLVIGHDFHETSEGMCITIGEAARREILDRRLALNHERYVEEVAQGLHDKGKKKGKRTKSKRASKNRDDQWDLI